ncbi:MAG TPA: hypothetical protein VGQ59_09085 [Cyclobacteriaceae bacterium]|jgi:hypothetical protein|nr:hypothetical protein [Cyclobacteriaceae bacterium]
MKTHALVLFFLALIVGCSKKSDPSPANSNTPSCLLTKATLTGSSTAISYNSSNQPTSVVITYSNSGPANANTYNVTVDASGRITKLATSGTPNGYAFSALEATYSGSNVFPTTYKLTFSDGSYTQNTATFNSSNQVTQVVSSSYYQSPGTTSSSYTTYTYANATSQNPLKAESFIGLPTEGGDKYEVHDYTYDDKNLPGGASLMSFFSTGISATNNILTDKDTYSPGTAGEYVTTQTFTYQYNSNGFPTKRSYSVLGGSTITESYTYGNCN